jgi:folate-binding protein YgfZ
LLLFIDVNQNTFISELGRNSLAVCATKGCYLGQEITHRTAHKGQVKKGLYRGPTIPSDDLSIPQPLISSVHPNALSLYVLEHQDATRHPALTRVYP